MDNNNEPTGASSSLRNPVPQPLPAAATATASPPPPTPPPSSSWEDEDQEEEEEEISQQPSMTLALFVSWILPVLLMATYARHAVDVDIPTLEIIRPAPKDAFDKPIIGTPSSTPKPTIVQPTTATTAADTKVDENKEPLSNYEKVVAEITKRRKYWNQHSAQQNVVLKRQTNTKKKKEPSFPTTSESTSNNVHSSRAFGSVDPIQEEIDKLRRESQRNPDDTMKAIMLARLMFSYFGKYGHGIAYQTEVISTYERIIEMAKKKRQDLMDKGEPTNLSAIGTQDVNLELIVDDSQKSADGLLCDAYSNLGKFEFISNMFERSVESFNHCLEVEPYYLDALNGRADSLLVLGRYEEAGADFLNVVKRDQNQLFSDAFVGLAKVLDAKESVIPGGWETVVTMLEQMIPQFESQIEERPDLKKNFMDKSLQSLHHTMFTYHDKKTKDTSKAWEHLQNSCRHKMAMLTPSTKGSSKQRVDQLKQVFHSGFWMYKGSDTRTPIFIVGFPRSGSTLLERVLDAHPSIVGTGENSIFNGQLDEVRNRIIIEAETTGRVEKVTNDMGKEIVDKMRQRWKIIEERENKDKPATEDNTANPQRFVDKMLNNYYNIGMIHMLYPQALILHVVREPMDVLFSVHKHNFVSDGGYGANCDFSNLAEMYVSYREIMEYWDQVLPDRVTHVLYEDMIHDMPNVARAVIKATGMPWDDGVLEFHKKKHAVNTLSTTQVRKGVYTHSQNAWKRYEKELEPLVHLIGDRAKHGFSTSLKGYKVLAEEN